MTEYKKNAGGPKYRSLYIGLFINLAKGLVLAIAVWLIVMMLSYYVIGVYYTAPEIQQSRREAYISELGGDVSWFCKKFDYRYDNEPWYNAKDAIPRAISFLTGGKNTKL